MQIYNFLTNVSKHIHSIYPWKFHFSSQMSKCLVFICHVVNFRLVVKASRICKRVQLKFFFFIIIMIIIIINLLLLILLLALVIMYITIHKKYTGRGLSMRSHTAINIVPVYVSARYVFRSPNYNHKLHMVEHSYWGNLLTSMFCRRSCS